MLPGKESELGRKKQAGGHNFLVTKKGRKVDREEVKISPAEVK